MVAEGDWKLLVATEESAYMARVALVVYGDEGSSGEIVLGEAGQHGMFQSGNQDQFKVRINTRRFPMLLSMHKIVETCTCLFADQLIEGGSRLQDPSGAASDDHRSRAELESEGGE